jgi:predicted acyl esterase
MHPRRNPLVVILASIASSAGLLAQHASGHPLLRNLQDSRAPLQINYDAKDWHNTTALCDARQLTAARASTFGCYRGYSREKYDSFVRESIYVPVSDGTRLAVDIFHPAIHGKQAAGRFPVIFNYSRYWRADEFPNGVVSTAAGDVSVGQGTSSIEEAVRRRATNPDAMRRNERWDNKGYGLFLAHGYVVVKAEARGTGASFGMFYGDMSGVEARDGHDLAEWTATQPWSSGKVGMVGQSYEGMEQYLVASTHPPHLLAAFPGVGTFDEYRVAWAGTGVLRKYGIAYLTYVSRRDGTSQAQKGAKVNAIESIPKEVGRVDEDQDGALREAARRERLKNTDALNPFTYFMRQSPEAAELYRLVGQSLGTDSPTAILEVIYSTPRLEQQLAKDPGLRQRLSALNHYRDEAEVMVKPQPTGPNNLAVLAPQVRSSGVAIYNWGSWRDYQTTDQPLWHANLGPNKKLTMGPWTHNQDEPDDIREDASDVLHRIEQLRWMDYWLKSIGNGVLKEPAVHAAIALSGQDFAWLQTNDWPVKQARYQDWNIGAGQSLSVDNGGAPGVDRFTVDYHSTMGEHTRYHDAIGLGPEEYPDLEAHARTGALAFTSAPLVDGATVLGAPIVTLYVTASTPDADVHAYLEKIDAQGNATYLSDGVLRASHRTLGTSPYDNLGLPWSDSSKAVVTATPGMTESQPVKLQFDLQPLGARFAAGERIRLVIAGADANTNLTIPQDPPTVLGIYHGAQTLSSISLPTVPPGTVSGLP